MIYLTGAMTCPPDRRDAVRAALPAHIALTRQENGCITFDVAETTPGVFTVSETFADQAAFDAHQLRAGASTWAKITAGLPRNYTVTKG
ncbi:Quinol monooxygenase YgiN [Loktanella sp. DSM 29012]|uniref:putative quinol monooxygenase n=1 Tax=Loktanella sp. DSM 29012 TaxID=1881056 RepID=UPI0008AFF4C0|nr:putative quinol monooxygenase [Loktanella sp. DSM 29012]SEQ15446.1 Quinol monooxygenase YgiN [Loktanella sp. DSM 29012]